MGSRHPRAVARLVPLLLLALVLTLGLSVRASTPSAAVTSPVPASGLSVTLSAITPIVAGPTDAPVVTGTVTNAGPDTATGVTVTVRLLLEPPSTTFAVGTRVVLLDDLVTVNELALVSTSSMVKIKAPVVVLGRID